MGKKTPPPPPQKKTQQKGLWVSNNDNYLSIKNSIIHVYKMHVRLNRKVTQLIMMHDDFNIVF